MNGCVEDVGHLVRFVKCYEQGQPGSPLSTYKSYKEGRPIRKTEEGCPKEHSREDQIFCKKDRKKDMDDLKSQET